MSDLFGESDLEKEGKKSSKLARTLTLEGLANLKGIEDSFYANPMLSKLDALQGEILSNPFTYNDQLKASLTGDATNVALKSAENASGQFGAAAERLGIGRSAAGGAGLANLTRLMGQGGAVNAAQGVDRMAAESRLADLRNAVQSGMAFLTERDRPRRESALAKLGQLSGLTGLAATNYGAAAQETGPLDFIGQGIGAFTGGLALGGANSLLPFIK